MKNAHEERQGPASNPQDPAGSFLALLLAANASDRGADDRRCETARRAGTDECRAVRQAGTDEVQDSWVSRKTRCRTAWRAGTDE
eukprot:1143093-Pelagomonas_calceolata.AAC.2